MKEILKNIPPLVNRVTLKIACITKYNDYQVEIRDSKTDLLIWRAWDFEPGFEADFTSQLEQFAESGDKSGDGTK